MRSRVLLCGAALLLVAGGPARAVSTWDTAPPPPPFARPVAAQTEQDVEAIEARDPRRADLLVDVAICRHLDAEAAEREELAAAVPAGSGGRGPPRSSPRADALRGEAFRLAERATAATPPPTRLQEALLVMGLHGERLGRARDASRALARLIRLRPGGPLEGDAWLAMGEDHLREGNLTAARAAFQAAERVGRPPVRAWAGAREAEIALAAADPEGAVAALERAVDAGSVRALALLDDIALAPRRLPARQALARVAALLDRTADPAHARSVRRSAGLPAAGRDDAAGRAPLLLRTSAAPPSLPGTTRDVLRLGAAAADPAALHALALAALGEGRASDARGLLERALAAPAYVPAGAAIRNDLAVALHAEGDVAAARGLLRSALELEPSDAVVRENLQRLDEPVPAAGPAATHASGS